MNEITREQERAYVAVQVQRLRSNEVADSLRDIPGVTYAGYAIGTVDVLVKIEAKDLRSLLALITQIRRTPGVVKTASYLVVREGGESKGREKEVGGIMFASVYATANIPEILERLSQEPSVNSSSLVLGEYDLVVEMTAKTLPELREVIRSIQAKEKDFISTVTVPVLS